ncbi:MAG: aminoacyl-tRNA hydrolase [Thermodesulfobacteriota bacterium]|nr:aminoacyl-tRNA hydrolase [Thermodesulfobacteriota bacterium]
MGDAGRLIVGLGNPGSKYELTRHNAGFLALDFFADQHGFAMTCEKWQGVYCRERLAGVGILLVKSQTFMNKSGESLVRYADFYKIAPADILVVHDDLDLSAGRIKVVARGGAGGHNGIRSIINHLGTSDFARLKLGIGRPERNEQGQGIPVERYVLSRFSDQEFSAFNEQLSLANEAIELFIEKGIDACMNTINRR